MAGTIQTGTALLRGMSTLSTGGAANMIVATAELAGSVITTILSLLIPVLAFTMCLLIALWVLWRVWHRPIKSR